MSPAMSELKVSWASAKRTLWSGLQGKAILVYMTLHAIVLCMQIVVSWKCKSLALLSHCFFSIFDLGEFAVACTSQVCTTQSEGLEPFPFGLRRVAVLARFANMSLLFFTGMFVGVEALHRLNYHDSGIDNTEGIVFVLVVGVFFKVCTLLAFKHLQMLNVSAWDGSGHNAKMTLDMRAILRTSLC